MDITSKQTQYAEDVSTYLESKLPYVNKATLMEIAEYIGYRTARLVADSIEAATKPEAAAATETCCPKSYREALEQFAPHWVDDKYKGGVYGCPGTHFKGAITAGYCRAPLSCTDCWGAAYQEEEYICEPD